MIQQEEKMEAKRIPYVGKVWASEERHAIVDLGRDDDAPRRAETLIQCGLPRGNFCVWIQGRLIARVRHELHDTLIEAGAPIVKGGTYAQTTHHWQGIDKGEDMAPTSCASFDRAEEERNTAERREAGSLIFNKWKWWPRATRAVSKELGGIRRFGINTPIRVETVARVHGVGNELSSFLDGCQAWQRADIGRIMHTVAIEAIGRTRPLREHLECNHAIDALVASSTSWDAKVTKAAAASVKELNALYDDDPASLAAHDAGGAALKLEMAWMKTDHFHRGTEIAFPAIAACMRARRAAGWGAVIGEDLPTAPPMHDGRRPDIWAWEKQIERHPAFVAAVAAENAAQVERLADLTFHETSAAPDGDSGWSAYLWKQRLAADTGFAAAVERTIRSKEKES